MKSFRVKINLVVLVVFFLFGSVVSFAQPPGGGQKGGGQNKRSIPDEQQIEKMVSSLANEISLSDAQESSVLKLYVAHFDELEKKTSGSSRPDRDEMEVFKSKFEEEVKALLNTDQKKAYSTYLKDQQSQRPNR